VGRVLKLFHTADGDERADREFAATQTLHAAGLSVPDAYERVEIEGRSGIVFERVDGPSMYEYTQARPWTLFAAMRQFAELHTELHRGLAPAGLPSLHDRIRARIDAADSPETDKQAARALLASLPDGTALCHGDFHPGNVVLTRRGPVVIDWSSGSRGDPIGDVAWSSRLMRNAHLPTWAPRYAHLMLRCLRSRIDRAYLHRYFQLRGGTPQQVEAWQAPLAVAARSWRGLGAENSSRSIAS
jgi:aminoglycoside phosphotransferase (APT) family kinase protein